MSIIEKPQNHIWDRDGLFRNQPELLPEISQLLIELKAEHEMEIYLVVYSSMIGEKPGPFARRCHEAWFDDRSDAIVFVLTFNQAMTAELGRSLPLYDGHLIEEGILPRISFPKIFEILQKSVPEVQNETTETRQVLVFVDFLTRNIREHFEASAAAEGGRESYHFMGWMALALLLCALLMVILSKVLGAVDRRTRKTYLLPDFIVPRRLKAPNGGGKMGVVDFTKPQK